MCLKNLFKRKSRIYRVEIPSLTKREKKKLIKELEQHPCSDTIIMGIPQQEEIWLKTSSLTYPPKWWQFRRKRGFKRFVKYMIKHPGLSIDGKKTLKLKGILQSLKTSEISEKMGKFTGTLVFDVILDYDKYIELSNIMLTSITPAELELTYDKPYIKPTKKPIEDPCGEFWLRESRCKYHEMETSNSNHFCGKEEHYEHNGLMPGFVTKCPFGGPFHE